MINQALINPSHIVVVGASENIEKPGGKILKNLMDSGYLGELMAVNPKQSIVQGIKAYPSVSYLPQMIDLAVLAIAAENCPQTVRELAENHGTRAFIIISAGFSEDGPEGKKLEQEIVDIVNQHQGCLIGPNCVGIVTPSHSSIFTTPVPQPNAKGADLISASGAVAVFIMETGLLMGLQFNNVFSVGNSAQLHVEDVLEYLDETYQPQKHSPVKLLYFENINNAAKLLKHALSLYKKGCRIAAIKAGTSSAGSRAAMSHTGSLAGNDDAVNALFKKAGIIRCSSRAEMTHVAAILLHTPKWGNNTAIITHAGGPAVMLTDVLETGGFSIPKITGEAAQKLLEKLHHGASTANPIDLLATGTAEQLSLTIDACEHDFNEIENIIVIYGSAGLFDVTEIYSVLHNKIKRCKKPILAILPSVINAKKAIEQYAQWGHPVFTDEVALGNALVTIKNTPAPIIDNNTKPQLSIPINNLEIKCNPHNEFLMPQSANLLLDKAGIKRPTEYFIYKREDIKSLHNLHYPMVAKVLGPLHKTEFGGVITNIFTQQQIETAIERLMSINGAIGVVLQQQIKGVELFIGAKKEPDYGHLIVFGLGGIYVETLRDVAHALCPITAIEALALIKKLKSYALFKEHRNQPGINAIEFANTIEKISLLLMSLPQISEMDLNPIIANNNDFVCVDVRIGIEKPWPPN